MADGEGGDVDDVGGSGEVRGAREGGGGEGLLGVDGGAVRDGGHADEGGVLHGVGAAGGHVHPQAGLEVDARARVVVVSACLRVRDVLDDLDVGDPVQEDVVLRFEPPVRHALQVFAEAQRLGRQVDLQHVLVGRVGDGVAGHRVVKGGRRRRGAVGSKDEVHAVALVPAGEVGQNPQRRFLVFGDRRGRRLVLEPGILRADGEGGRKSDLGLGGGVGGGDGSESGHG